MLGKLADHSVECCAWFQGTTINALHCTAPRAIQPQLDRRCVKCARSMDGVHARSRTPCAAVVCQALCALRQTGAKTPSICAG